MFECALGMQYLHGVGCEFPLDPRFEAHCHCQRGLVHGGLKPTNILVADNGQVCIADYDMIGIESSGCVSAHQYFSPEAWKGVRSSKQKFANRLPEVCVTYQIISKPSDVFAFAMSCYEVGVFACRMVLIHQNGL